MPKRRRLSQITGRWSRFSTRTYARRGVNSRRRFCAEGHRQPESGDFRGHRVDSGLYFRAGQPLPDAPVGVGMRAWTPFILGDSVASNTPGAVFELHLRNRLGQLSEEVLKDCVTISDPMAQRVADAASLSTKWNL